MWLRQFRQLGTRALQYASRGKPSEVLSLVDVDLNTQLGPGEALTKTLGAMVHPADINTIEGVYPRRDPLPATGGYEGVVEVLAVSEDVRELKPGDWALPTKGGGNLWCSHAVRPVEKLHKIDNTIPVEMAACISVNPCTAYRMLVDFTDLEPGDVVIQNGSTSAVGQAVVQIAKEMQLTTINIVRDRPGVHLSKAMLQDLGAEIILTEKELKEQRKELPNPKLALNCVGGRGTLYLAGMLARHGKLVTYGGMSKQPLSILTSSFIFNDISCHGFWMTNWYSDKENSDKRWGMMQFLLQMVNNNTLRPPSMQTVHIDHWKDAIMTVESGTGPKQMLVFE